MTRRLIPVTAAFLVLLPLGHASAHILSKSQSDWTLTDGGAVVEFRIPEGEFEHLPAGTLPIDYWPANLTLQGASGTGCTPGPAVELFDASGGWAAYRWEIDCGGDTPARIRSDLLAGLVPQHVHLARVVSADDESRERMLVTRDPVWTLDDATEHGSPLANYLLLGVDHILRGWDHLAFVLALVLLVGSLREILKLVTGFTLAHSLTLAMAALGWLRPDPAAVEILIGFSIALVAAENCWLRGGRPVVVPVVLSAVLLGAGLLAPMTGSGLGTAACLGLALFTWCHFRLLQATDRTQLLRGTIAFAFGLIHGFGFGGALLDIGLPADRIVPALFGFNVGVELGQLIVVALVYPVLAWTGRRSPRRAGLIVDLGSAGVFAVGIFWMVSRNWFGGS